MNPTLPINYVILADEYRCLWKKSGGIVIFHQGEIQGWCDTLRDPSDWKPGCIALDDKNQLWVAEGGNGNDGAQLWERMQ